MTLFEMHYLEADTILIVHSLARAVHSLARAVLVFLPWSLIYLILSSFQARRAKRFSLSRAILTRFGGSFFRRALFRRAVQLAPGVRRSIFVAGIRRVGSLRAVHESTGVAGRRWWRGVVGGGPVQSAAECRRREIERAIERSICR